MCGGGHCLPHSCHMYHLPVTMQAIFIPAVGIMGNDFDRVILICIGSLCWGGMSVGFGFARDLKQVSQQPLIPFMCICNLSLSAIKPI